MHVDTTKAGAKHELLSTNCPQGKCRGWFVEKSSCLAPALGVTKFTDMILVTLCSDT